MLNLDVIINKSYKIKLFGEIINVNQPSLKTLKKFNAATDSEDIDLLDVQQEFVLDILNNNTSARTFKKAEIEALPVSVIVAVIDEISNGVTEADNNPN